MPSTYSNLLYHIVFSTKQRIPLITTNLQDELYRYIGGIIRGEGGALIEVGGMPDHIHLLAQIKPAISVAEMLNRIKANSSKWANETKMELRKFGWQEGYAAFSVSESKVSDVAQYIRNQVEHHRTLTYQEEFLELLKRHGVEFDPQYVWD